MAVLPFSTHRQNCNLELRLSPSPASFSADHLHHFLDDQSTKTSQQQMTIFYNGRVCVADFTEDQARAIILLATRQMDETSRQKSEPPSLSMSSSSQQCNNGEAGSGLSMKRSLQRFLQKRKNRIQSASPYNH